jgi:two-component system, chemotaxis family, chemotaxis protein CheY
MPPGPILIVEDDDDIRESLGLLLSLEGYAVESAANGVDALGMLDRPGAERPKLILLDLMMPVMNGIEFHQELRRRPALSGLPVVVLSGDPSVDQKAATMGVAGALRKPVEGDRLIEVVRRHAGG